MFSALCYNRFCSQIRYTRVQFIMSPGAARCCGKLPAKLSRRNRLYAAHFPPTVRPTVVQSKVSKCRTSPSAQSHIFKNCFLTHGEFPAEYFLPVFVVNEDYSHKRYPSVIPTNKSHKDLNWVREQAAILQLLLALKNFS
jgi:hypothetical protein